MGLLHACPSGGPEHRLQIVCPASSSGLSPCLTLSLTIDYTSKICRQAYPPGKHFTVPDVPDVDEVNARGDYTIEADRLAFIDGDRDPWRPMVSSSWPAGMASAITLTPSQTPQSDVAPRRSSTVNRPLAMIFGESTYAASGGKLTGVDGVHHYDEVS